MKVAHNDILMNLNALKATLESRKVTSNRDIQQKDGSVKAIQGFIKLVKSGDIGNQRQLRAKAQLWMAKAHREQNKATSRQLTGMVSYYKGAHSASLTVLSLV